jgi:hypothetical protein
MTRFITAGGLVLSAFLVAGCATTMNVSSHVERGLDFAQYRTYNWGPADALPTGDARLDENPFFKDRFMGAVERQLTLRGMEATTTAPDVLIHYHANVRARMDVDRIDRTYGYCQTEGCPGLREYEAGTFVLDVIDARTNRLIWRGWAQSNFDNVIGNPDRLADTIDEAVKRMMERFPRPL